MAESEIIHVARLVTSAFDDLPAPYVIGGSLATVIHGLMNTSLDVDIVADLSLKQVNAFLDGLNGEFYLDNKSIKQAVQRRGRFNLVHLESMVKVDIFMPVGRPFDRQQLNRRIPLQIGPDSDRPLFFLSAEDLILAKLDWFRQGGEISERQWRDILGILKIQQNRLDVEYLAQWAHMLNVSDLLVRALESINGS